MLIQHRTVPDRGTSYGVNFMYQMILLLLFVFCLRTTQGQNCFGGIQSFEKLAMTDFDDDFSPAGTLLQQPDQALTRDCINLCRQQPTCLSFGLDYTRFRCAAYSVNSQNGRRGNLVPSNTTNYFEKVCYLGVHREEYQKVCGVERLWAFERVKGAFLEGFVETTLSNIGSKDECAKSCMMEASFTCRSADYDNEKRVCHLSKEDRRTQPQAFRLAYGSSRDYLENQCAAPGPTTCLYDTKPNAAVITMDSLVFAQNIEDCEHKCDKEYTFNCRSYSIDSKRCFLSGDDSVSLSNAALPLKHGSVYGEKKCVTETCTHGIFTYEKVTGMVLRSALATSVPMPHTTSLGVTGLCRDECDKSNLNCPAFSVNYQNARCDRLDRNSQGRSGDFIPREGESYFEKICLRGPDIMTMCQDKYWAFERVIGYELTPLLYERVYHFVQSRRYCEEYCLQEKLFVCRSALYNDETTECKLSREDRRTKPANFIRNQNPKINYLENQCIRSHSRCPYEDTPGAYPTYTDLVETRNVVTRDICEGLCSEAKKFLCRSYAFYSSNNECLLSGDDRASAGSSAITPRPGMTYYERRCAKIPNDHFPATGDDNSIGTETEKFTPSMPTTHSTEPDRSASTGDQTSPFDPLTSTSGHGSSTDHIKSHPSTLPTRFSPSPTDHSTNSATDQSMSSAGSTDTSHSSSSDSTSGTGNQDTFSTKYDESTTHSSSSVDGSSTFRPETLSPPTTSLLTPTSTPSTIPGKNEADYSSPRIGHRKIVTAAAMASELLSPSTLKCGPNGRFAFERIPGFEPIGGFFSLLYSDKSSAGIVTECSRRCEHNIGCTAFVMDYTRQACFGLFENSSIGRLDLRLSPGRDYFEGFCVASHLTCLKLWAFDRIVDQASIGVQPKSIIRYLHKSDCRARCLEERRFTCLSASYDATLRECRLYDQDRNSGLLRLVFTKGTDYIENQCNIDVTSCRYHPIERDITIASVTKSFRGSSTFFCEQECNRQKEFNCRSYTYLDQTTIPGGNICLLSSDSRGTSQKEAMGYRPRALYAEKDCRGVRKGRVSSTPETAGGTDTTQQQTHQLPSSPPVQQHQTTLSIQQQPQTVPSQSPPPILKNPTITHIPTPPRKCSTFEFTYEKTYGFDLRFARRERSRLPPRSGITTACQDECTRRGPRCRAFSIEYGHSQHCFLLEDSAGENRLALTKSLNSAYFEKTCLKAKPCGKLWSFERIIGYTLNETPDREIINVDLRSDCLDHCLAEKNFVCRSATYDYAKKSCKLFTETQRSRPSLFKPTSEEIDYLENHCVKEPTNCQYKDFTDTFFPNIDRLTHAFSLNDCQRQCDVERLFPCRSVNFESYSRECSLSSYDIGSIGVGQSALQIRRNTVYSEKGNCEQVTVQCNPQDMVLTLNFDTPFMGRVYAKGNPAQCFEVGTGQTRMQFAISFGSRCGTRQEGLKNFVNEIVVQQHAVIMTDSDRTIKVMCTLSAIDQTVTLSSVAQGRSGIDVTSLKNVKSRLERPISSVVTNTATPPTVMMRILDRSERDATLVSLGDELTMKIEIMDLSSAFAISARNLYARSSSGESLFLIDGNGCPTDSSIFPALRVDSNDRKSLRATFKAFRFPSSGFVNFEVQIRFCPEKCQPVKCVDNLESFGRKKRESLINSSKVENGDDKLKSFASRSLEGQVFREIMKNRSALKRDSESYSYPDSPEYQGYNNYEVSLQTTTMVPSLPAPLELVGNSAPFNGTAHQYIGDYRLYDQNSYNQPNNHRQIVSGYPSLSNGSPSSPSSASASSGYPYYSPYGQPSVPSYNYGHSYGQPPHQLNLPVNNQGGYSNYPGYGSNTNNGYGNLYPGYTYSQGYNGQNSTNNFQPLDRPFNQPNNYYGTTRVVSSSSSPSSGINSFYSRETPSSPSSVNIVGVAGSPQPSNRDETVSPLPSSSGQQPSRSRPSNGDRKKFRPPRPLPRPKGMPANPMVINSPPEANSPEVPLSLAIVVGDKEKSAKDKNKWNLEPNPKDKSPSSSEIISIPCNTGPAILYTAIIVTLAHCLVVACGYFYYKKYIYYTGASKLFNLAGRTISTENITTSSSTVTRNPRASNSNVFFGSPSVGLTLERNSPSSASVTGFRSLYSTGTVGSPP